MTTTFRAFQYVAPLRHLDSMTLLSFRDSLREANLTVTKPRKLPGEDKMLLGADTMKLVKVIDSRRIRDGIYMVPTSVEDAMDYHIAANIILAERGFTSKIDNPEITIELPASC